MSVPGPKADAVFVPSPHAHLMCASCTNENNHYVWLCPTHAAEHPACCLKHVPGLGADKLNECILTPTQNTVETLTMLQSCATPAG